MPFLETPRFPDAAAYWAKGGPEYSTEVVEVLSGIESRNARWPIGRARYSFGGVDFARKNMDQQVIAFFRAARGRYYGFRFKDWADYQVAGNAGSLVLAGTVSTSAWRGAPVAQLAKLYTSGSLVDVRPIRKPVAGTVALTLNGSPLVAGTAYALDTTTGLVTWVATASAAVSSITLGATTSLTLGAALGTLGAGDLLWVTGLTGADAGLLNGQPLPIASRSGSTYVLSVNTTGKTITAAGTAYAYPGSKAGDVVQWTGQFDVPVRFDVDQLQGSFGTGGLFTWESLKLVEVLR